MGRRLNFPVLAVATLALIGCINPLMDKVKAVVAQKDMLPKINLKTAAGSIATGGSFDFGSISIDTSKDVTFTIENLGTGTLSLTDTPKVSISGTDASLFAVVSDPTTPIPAGSSSSFVLRFLPTTNGAKSATLTIPNSDATNSNYAVSLSGTGSIQAAIRVWQDGTEIAPGTGSYSYPQTGLTYAAPDITFTIKNDGTATLNLTGTPKVQSSGDFSVFSQPASTSIAAYGGTTTFVLRFTPSAEGTRTSTITIPNDDPDRSPFTFTARGIASTVMLPKTGQTTPYSTGVDENVTTGAAWPATRFSASGQSIIDNLTGLQWAKNGNLMGTSYMAQDNDDTPGDGLVLWQTSLNFIAYLNGIGYDGHADWRLPNRDEIRSLVNFGQAANETWLNNVSQGFSNVVALYYWTSTSYAGSTGNAWRVSMNNGTTAFVAMTTNYHYAWPVRGGSGGIVRLAKTGRTTLYAAGDDGDLEKGVADPVSRFLDNADGTITDQLTGLMWEKAPSSSTYTWQQAVDAASASATGAHPDWRVPNISELESLLNAEQSDSTIYLALKGFSNLTNVIYWSSTTRASATADAWAIQLGSGSISSGTKTGATRPIILVRSIQ